MPLSVVDLYVKILPKTNCGDCGFATCLAFASMVVSEKLPLARCPHLSPREVAAHQAELDAQHAAGRWTKKDMAADALKWAKQRSAVMSLEEVHRRIGGSLEIIGGKTVLALPYFTDVIRIDSEGIARSDGTALNRWEQVFVYNHMAQGGSALPGQQWTALEQIPNTVSKIKSMRAHVEQPLVACFRGRVAALHRAAERLGAIDAADQHPTADAALVFRPLPRIPVLLLFWDAADDEGFDASAKLRFDKTISEHLDIESIMFLSERIRELLCGDEM